MSIESKKDTNNSYSQDNEEEISIQVEMPINSADDEYSEDINEESSDSEDYSPISNENHYSSEIDRFTDLLTIDYFNGSNLLVQSGYIINENFEGILVVGDNMIIVIDKNADDSF